MGEKENNNNLNESPVTRWFKNAVLGATMADLPAMMTASGWRLNEKGDYVLDQQNDPHVELLRDNLAVEGLGVMGEVLGAPAIYGVTKLINPGFGKFNWFTKKFYPHKAKRLDELQHLRLFIKEHPYEYVPNREVINAMEVADDGKHLYRSVQGDRGIPHSRINTETNFSTEVELIDPMTGKLLYDDAPAHTAWTSTRPKYVGLSSKEIHILPESDFTFVKRMNENRKSAGYVNSFDKDSRIVNSSGFNLDSGSHFIKIPQANSFARMKNGIDYDISSYKSPISNYSTLFPGIGRGPNGWNIHKAYKLGLIGAGTVGGMVYGLGNL